MKLRSVQRDLYFAQRTLGDVDAARRGPDVLAKRLIRRRATRDGFALLRLMRRGGGSGRRF